ncbi:MAG: NAD-dependent epimerase/dehydratase family protein [Myxococcota bacterium]|nr:NAD-dependent epimerase/dehydratase family protein [Myxococcota bacterium]
MSVVVTGAGGHVGATLIRSLLKDGHTVRALDLDPGIALEGLSVETRSGDIRDPEFLRGAFEAGDTLFHLASVISTSGDKGGLVSSVNVDGARNVATIAAACGIKRMVHFSSIHAFDIDTHGAPVTEKTRLATANSRSAYNLSKARGQLEVLKVVEEKGLDAVIVHPCGVIGPYDYKPSRMGKFFRGVAKGHNAKVGPGGFNWVDVRDVVDGARAAMEKGRTGEGYILGGRWASNLELGQMSSEITGKPVPDKAIAMWVLKLLNAASPLIALLGQSPPINQEIIDALIANPDMSSDKAAAELGYSPRPIRQTVEDIFRWYETEDIIATERARRKAEKPST